MIVKMKFINISGPRDDIDRVTDQYLSRYEIQLESALSELKPVQNLRPFVELNPYRDSLALANQFVSLLENADDVTPDASMGLDDMFELVRMTNDDYLEIQEKKETVKKHYREYNAIKKELETYELDEEQRRREISFLEYEIQEIQNAELKDGEDEELEHLYRKLVNSRKITENLGGVYQLTGYEEEGSGTQTGRALQKLSQISDFDESLENLYRSLEDIDSLLNDFNREVSAYLSEFRFSEEEFQETENRLDGINHLKAKYGHTIPEIRAYQEEKERELERLRNFEERKGQLEGELEQKREELEKASRELTQVRKSWAKKLENQITKGLEDLNFLNVEFEIRFSQKEKFSPQGKDSICFMISTNPGEPVRELSKVVSGGELSRIMLAIKTLLADKDDTETLIFDEIDTGISGRTAQKVAEKMAVISRNHQIICITHLPQIAAMGDHHLRISKSVRDGRSYTDVSPMDRAHRVDEIARLLSGEEISDAARRNAEELLDAAGQGV